MDAYLKRLNQAMLESVKDAMQRAPEIASAYTGEFLRPPSDKTGLVKSKAGNLYYNLPNKTNRLRTLYGNIQRAITPRDKGNFSEVNLSGGTFIFSFGIDPDTTVKAGKKSTTLLYALFHETKGKRPFLNPGFKKFMTDKGGFPELMADIERDIAKFV